MPPSDDFLAGRRRLQGEIDQLFFDLLARPRSRGAPAIQAPADVYVTDDPAAVVVQLDIAGVDPQDVDVALERDLLTVRGRRARPTGERRVYHHAEIDWGPFERRLRLNVPVEAEGARASYERGLLTILLPIAPRVPPSTVAIAIRIGV